MEWRIKVHILIELNYLVARLSFIWQYSWKYTVITSTIVAIIMWQTAWNEEKSRGMNTIEIFFYFIRGLYLICNTLFMHYRNMKQRWINIKGKYIMKQNGWRQLYRRIFAPVISVCGLSSERKIRRPEYSRLIVLAEIIFVLLNLWRILKNHSLLRKFNYFGHRYV